MAKQVVFETHSGQTLVHKDVFIVHIELKWYMRLRNGLETVDCSCTYLARNLILTSKHVNED